MGASNTLLYVIATLVVVHFLAGIAYLIYKIGTATPVETAMEEHVDPTSPPADSE